MSFQLSPKKKSTTNYYGPLDTNTFESPQDTADFVALPTYNKSIKRKKKVGTGFNQTDSALSNRANRFSGRGGVKEVASLSKAGGTSSGEWDKYMGKTTIGGTNKILDEEDYEKMTIKGTCQTLEKAYLRLTAPPRAELVRPEPVLQRHLQNLKLERQKRSHDYLWFCSQLKAVRQDCTVQRIQNAFTVDVYETHARMALEERDLNEYNQCQTQLKELYAVLEKEGNSDADGLRNRNEFLAYRLIYYVFLAVENQKYDGGSSDIFKIMLSLSFEQKQDALIRYALAVREACCSDILDYHAFFVLQRNCPTTGASHLMDRVVPPMRYKALQRICKGYRPSTVAVSFVLEELGFENESHVFGLAWLRSCGCVLSHADKELVTKDTVIHESVMEEKQSLI